MAKFIQPMHDRILVQRAPSLATTSGGLFIPHTGREKPQEARVVATGEGRQASVKGTDGVSRLVLQPIEVKPGDQILIGKLAGSEIKIDGEEYLIVREDDVLGVIE